MSKAIPLLFFVLSLFCLCPSASALPQQHEVWHQGNDAYRTSMTVTRSSFREPLTPYLKKHTRN